MAQLQHIDARLNTLSDELCQVNTCVGRIAQHQAIMGGFVTSPPTPKASEDEDEDDATTTSNDEDDGEANSSSAHLPFVTRDKKEE